MAKASGLSALPQLTDSSPVDSSVCTIDERRNTRIGFVDLSDDQIYGSELSHNGGLEKLFVVEISLGQRWCGTFSVIHELGASLYLV
jgi:hypothetical protein